MTSSHSVKLKMLLCKKDMNVRINHFVCVAIKHLYLHDTTQVKSCNFYTFNMFMTIKRKKWLDGNKKPKK